MLALRQPGKAHALVEVLEVVPNSNGCAGEDHALHLGQPALGKVRAHVDLLGNKALGGHTALGAAELRRVDVAVVLAIADKADAGQQVTQEPAGLAQVGRQLGRSPRQKRLRLLELLGPLCQHGRGLLAAVAHGSPLFAGAHVGVNPQGHEVVAAVGAGQAGQLVHGHKEVRHVHGGAGHRCGGLGQKPLDGSGPIQHGGLHQQAVDDAGLGAAEQLKRHACLFAGDLHGPLAARLGLKRVGLVDDPVAHRRQDLALGLHVAQQQRVVGHHHVRAGRTAAGTVEQALVGVVRAARVQALAGLDGEHLARHVSPANAQRVQVSVGGLAGKRVGHGYGREHVPAHGVVGAAVVLRQREGQLVLDRAVKAVQARVVVVALEAGKGQAVRQGLRQGRQLVGDQLVGEGICLCGHTHGDIVALGKEHLRQQVRHGLAHAGAGLYGAVRGGCQGVGHLAGHLDLLGAALQALVHAGHGTRGAKLLAHLGGGDGLDVVLLGCVVALLGHGLSQQLRAHALEREAHGVVGQRQVREHRAEGPVNLGVHVCQVAEEPCRQVGEGAQDDAPHAAEGGHVIASAVGHRGAAKGLRHVRQAVRREARQGDA